MRLVNTSTTSPFNLFSPVVTCKIYFLSNFKLHNTVLLTIVTMLSIWFPELHLITRILYPLINISPFLSLPSPRQPPFYSPLLWVHRVLFKLLIWDTHMFSLLFPTTVPWLIWLSLLGPHYLYLVMKTRTFSRFSSSLTFSTYRHPDSSWPMQLSARTSFLTGVYSTCTSTTAPPELCYTCCFGDPLFYAGYAPWGYESCLLVLSPAPERVSDTKYLISAS